MNALRLPETLLEETIPSTLQVSGSGREIRQSGVQRIAETPGQNTDCTLPRANWISRSMVGRFGGSGAEIISCICSPGGGTRTFRLAAGRATLRAIRRCSFKVSARPWKRSRPPGARRAEGSITRFAPRFAIVLGRWLATGPVTLTIRGRSTSLSAEGARPRVRIEKACRLLDDLSEDVRDCDVLACKRPDCCLSPCKRACCLRSS